MPNIFIAGVKVRFLIQNTKLLNSKNALHLKKRQICKWQNREQSVNRKMSNRKEISLFADVLHFAQMLGIASDASTGTFLPFWGETRSNRNSVETQVVVNRSKRRNCSFCKPWLAKSCAFQAVLTCFDGKFPQAKNQTPRAVLPIPACCV